MINEHYRRVSSAVVFCLSKIGDKIVTIFVLTANPQKNMIQETASAEIWKGVRYETYLIYVAHHTPALRCTLRNGFRFRF